MVQKARRKSPSLRQTGIRYLYRLNETFYFRYIPPKAHRALSRRIPKQIKYSLRTVSKSLAIARLGALWAVLDKLPSASTVIELESLYEQLCFAQCNASTGQMLHAIEPLPSCITLQEAWVSYLQGKTWTEKRRQTVEQMFLNIKLFLGDEPVDTYRSRDIERALSSIAKLPQRNRKPYSSMSLEETAGLDVPPELRISDKTVKEHLKLMAGLFSTYLVKEAKLLAKSPTEGVTFKADGKRFGAFTDFEVKEILTGAASKPDWLYWFVMIGAYTGARRSEIARLTKSDFSICNDSKRYYFKVTQGKTAAAVRLVPLSNDLIEAGLIEYLESSRTEYLFDLAHRNPNRVTDLFGSLVTSGNDAYGDRLVFHSLRHTFITKARMAGLPTSLVQQYVGHSVTGAGVTDRYTHRYTIGKLAEVCDTVKY